MDEKWHRVQLILGGNIGNVRETFQTCLKKLIDLNYLPINQSSIYQSSAWGYPSENSYLNQVLILQTKNSAEMVLNDILEIERKLGRVRTNDKVYNDRTLDIDILFFDDSIIQQPNLVIPHPRLHLRRFCLVPMAEINAEFLHPVLQKSIADLLLECPDPSIIQAYEN